MRKLLKVQTNESDRHRQINIGSKVKAQFESDQAVKHLNGAIKPATEVRDNDSRALSEEILGDEAEHVD